MPEFQAVAETEHRESLAVVSYLEAAEWADCPTDENGEPVDLQGAVWSESAVQHARDAIAELYADDARRDEIAQYFEDGHTEQQLAIDLWLTRNGHGAGFWDRGPGNRYPLLDDHAKHAGSRYLYLGEDGFLYIEQ